MFKKRKNTKIPKTIRARVSRSRLGGMRERKALLDHEDRFVPTEFENPVSSFARILDARVFPATPFAIALFLFPSELPTKRFPICTSIFSLHSLGYYTPQRAPRIFPLVYAEKSTLHARWRSLLLLLLPSAVFSTGFPRREDGRANSFKSRCGSGNSANPLRIHRAPLANSSLAPNVFLFAHPFTAYRARSSSTLLSRSSLPFLSSFSSYFTAASHRTLQPAFRLSCSPFSIATRFRISRKCFRAS